MKLVCLKSACFYIWDILVMANVPIGESGLVIRYQTVGFLVPVRVNAPVRDNRPRK